MICDVCGRDNADNLTFCQDCGRRLKTRGQRVVAPTPPSGMPKVELPPNAPQSNAPAARSSPPSEAAPSGRLATPVPRQRPEAPAFSFGPPAASPSRPGGSSSAPPAGSVIVSPSGAPLADAAGSAPAAASAPSAAGSTCGNCGGANPPLYRFCMTCGAPLTHSAAGQAVARSSPPAAAAPQAAAGAEEKIVGSPVVDIAAGRNAPVKLITCSRCSAQCTPGTRFCKYCGALLEDAGDAAARSAPAAPAQVPTPAADAAPRASAAGAGSAASGPVSRDAPRPAPVPLRQPPPPLPPASLRAAPVAEPAAMPPPAPRPQPRGRFDGAVDGAPAGAVFRDAGGAPRGRLVVIVEDGTEGRSFPLIDQQVDVGRSEGDIRLEDDQYVSPRHARLAPVAGRWVIRDLESTNRVFLRLRKPHRLHDGDLLLLGLEVLQFQIVSEAERQLGHAIQHGTLLFGSPASPRLARLCQRTIEGVIRDVHHLVREETIIGRETGDIVFTADPFLSRRHAAIRHNPPTNEFVLADLDSSNGTYVAIRDEVPLSSGDFVRIGQHLFRVDFGSLAPRELGPPAAPADGG